MKKLLLLILSGSIAFASSGQERIMSFENAVQGKAFDYRAAKKIIRDEVDAHGNAYKTTAAPRWYSFADWFDTSETEGGTGAALTSTYMWKDTAAVMAYSGTSGLVWQHNRNVSLGMVVDPAFSGFNNVGYYNGQMKVTPTDAYSVDSIRFFGIYGFKPANTYVDTIRVTFVYGNADRGNGTSGPDVYLAKTGNPVVLSAYGQLDSMKTYRMHFDTNVTRTNGSTAVVRDIILDNTGASPAWGDTLSNGWYYGRVALPDVSVPAGNLIGATLTFISGSPTFAFGDTVFGSSLGYKHNMFRPLVIFRGTVSSSGSPAPVLVAYDSMNRNSGMFKTLPDTVNRWGGQYIPLWFWSATGGGASTNQYPYIDFHVKCGSCGTVFVGVNDVHRIIEAGAYPNPATGELHIPFTLAAPGGVTVSLSNILGQSVATQHFVKAEKGTATFNTTTWSPGIYMYTIVTDDGQRYTGKVSIAE